MAKARVVNVQFNSETIVLGEYAVKLLAEGDSWFGWAHLNLAPSSNLLEQLQFNRSAVVVSYAYSGDTIRRMGNVSSNRMFFNEIKGAKYDAILLSGGGNDLIDALPYVIPACDPDTPPASAEACINRAALKTLFDDYLLPNYSQIIDFRKVSLAGNRATPVIIHTYDYPTPRDAPATFLDGIKATGPWIWKALRDSKVPPAFDQAICDAIFEALGEALLRLHDPADGVHVVRTAGTIQRAAAGSTGLSGDWINEIHPDAYGYALLAEKINAQLTALGVS